MIDVEKDGVITREKWPKRPLIVTGSRDHSLRVWTLPRPGEEEFRCFGNEGDENHDVDPAEVCVSLHIFFITFFIYRFLRMLGKIHIISSTWQATIMLFGRWQPVVELLCLGVMIAMFAFGIS